MLKWLIRERATVEGCPNAVMGSFSFSEGIMRFVQAVDEQSARFVSRRRGMPAKLSRVLFVGDVELVGISVAHVDGKS